MEWINCQDLKSAFYEEQQLAFIQGIGFLCQEEKPGKRNIGIMEFWKNGNKDFNPLFQHSILPVMPLTALIHFNSMILLLTRPKEYFPVFQMIQCGPIIELLDPTSVYIAAALLDETSRFSLR